MSNILSKEAIDAIPAADFVQQIHDGHHKLNAFATQRFAALFAELPRQQRDGLCWQCYPHVQKIACLRILAHLSQQSNG